MNVVINGEPREIPEGLSVAALLDHLNMKPDRVAIELNREIVPRAQWDATLVQPNDSFEIVHFVGGGSDPTRVGVPSERSESRGCPFRPGKGRSPACPVRARRGGRSRGERVRCGVRVERPLATP
ncbi:MAG TPA: sulfur carrier protein ThiS [Candidatus Acidoferrales bacterium]|nr:sulfur carrier protein ThiS [Candidatus Acidoferrales bacterium]